MSAAPGIGDRSYGVIALRYTPHAVPGSQRSHPAYPTRANSQVLLIQQKTMLGPPKHPPFWCFPKGHAEDSDASLHATAIRELFEETGLVITEEDFLLGDDDAQSFREVYVNPMRNVGKEVRYWVVLVKPDEASKELQLQEVEVNDAAWYGWDEASQKITYGEARDMFEGVVEALEKHVAKL
ncbi:hypothetical protein PVAG01_05921 [Phlyctema vagabunda]|uniref:Nudix hydrolase domain-containing protein n=1 Tax=Phlyctema vagabunda TaxID=108571 RepID=A0ABR4PEL6_9HELO